jgi:LmbE family N-acetylglucosaminyl deacetylase
MKASLGWTLAAIGLAGLSLTPAARSAQAWYSAPRHSANGITQDRTSSKTLDSIAAPEIFQQMRQFRKVATVLHVGAHPDDENTQLIAALSRGRAVRTGYLSLTRGDGGQNLLGPDFGYKLGLARTQELLAARRVDGGRQFFTRALDFGFSKDYREAFEVWGKDSILSDVVRVIRMFRPDVIITRFSLVPGGTHGHHTGSAVLAVEAFKLAGDSSAFPDQVKQLGVWQPTRILMNSAGPGTDKVQLDIGGSDPVLGESFASLAARSRAMHKTQGFGQGGGAGGGRATGAGPRLETLILLGGQVATGSIFDGIDTTWARFPGGAEVERRMAGVMTTFNSADPAKSVLPLLEIRKIVAGLGDDPLVVEKRQLLDRIILECAGVVARTTMSKAEVVPGEALGLRSVFRATADVPVRLSLVRTPLGDLTQVTALSSAESALNWTRIIPPTTPLSQPYWLREESTPGMFRVQNHSLIGLPENPPVLPLEYVFDVAGERIELADEPVRVGADPRRPGGFRRLDVIPPASVGFATDVGVFKPGESRDVAVDVVASRDSTSGSVVLDAPSGWKIAPASQTVSLAGAGDRAQFTFNITAPQSSTTASIGAHVTIAGRRWNTSLDSIDYPHIPLLLLQPEARFKAVSADIATRGSRVAYIPGAGDDVPAAIRQMGYSVTTLPVKSVTAAALRGFDAVVIGVRASNVSSDLGLVMPALVTYANDGGVVIEQYNQNGGLRNTVLGPFPLTVGGGRVTNENAKVTFIAPESPVLNTPNKITAADFEGWIQERGIYFPREWDPRYKPILAMSDAGEAPLEGSLLVANVGKGYFVYTGLVFFRELPAGVPGAYRLFANLLSLGK